MSWFIRGIFFAALALMAGIAAWQYRVAGDLRTKLGSATEVANHNYAQFKLLQSQVDSERRTFRQTLGQQNDAVNSLFLASEAQRKAGEADATKLLDKAAVWGDHNANRKGIDRSEDCKVRLVNIGQFIDDYVGEVRRVEAH